MDEKFENSFRYMIKSTAAALDYHNKAWESCLTKLRIINGKWLLASGSDPFAFDPFISALALIHFADKVVNPGLKPAPMQRFCKRMYIFYTLHLYLRIMLRIFAL